MSKSIVVVPHKVFIYTRSRSAAFQTRIKLADGSWHRTSTECYDEDEAAFNEAIIALAVNLAKHNHFSWDVILGAEVVRTYKPAPESYTRACSVLGLEPNECMIVAAHNTVLAAARAQGFQTAFIRRPNEHGPAQTIDLEPSDDWEFKTESIIELSRLLDDCDPA